jgi:hypothetical protein
MKALDLRWFIVIFTTAHHWTLSEAKWIQFTHSCLHLCQVFVCATWPSQHVFLHLFILITNMLTEYYKLWSFPLYAPTSIGTRVHHCQLVPQTTAS